MRLNWKLAVALCVGLVGGAALAEGLRAESKSVLYIVEIEDIANADAFRAVTGRSDASAGDRVTKMGGRYVARTDRITAVDGSPPKRLIIQAFDSMEKLKTMLSDSTQKDIDANRMKNTKSRAFIAEAL